MATINENPSQYVVKESGIPRGCLYGCLFAVLGGIALMFCGGFGAYWMFTQQVEQYTSDVPADLPRLEYRQEQVDELQTRVSAFSEAFEQEQTPDEDLVLTADEINMLIDQEDQLRGKLFVRIEDGKISGDVSIPADVVPGGKGRYFNGSGSFEVDMVAGDLFVTLVDAEVNGVQLPQPFIEGMSRQNLARELYNNPEMRETLRRIESVTIDDDRIVLKVRRDNSDAENESESPDVDDSPRDEESAGDP